MNFSTPCLYAISQRSDFPGLTPRQYLERLFRTPALVVQLREKALPPKEVAVWARLGAELARTEGKSFLLNSHVRIALSEGCSGVHLTSRQSVSTAVRTARGSQGFVIGKSVHSLDEALAAEREGADYVMLGPVFSPLSKVGAGLPLGLGGLEEAVRQLAIPVAAVGGVQEDRLEGIFSTGVWAAAGITWAARAILGGEPPSPDAIRTPNRN